MAKKKNSVTVKRKAKSTRRTKSSQELEPGVTDRMRRVAVHEAGHAVAHIRLGIDQEYASIEPVRAEGDFENVEQLIETWELPGLEHWKCRAVELLSEPKNDAAVRLIADWLVTNRRIDAELLELLVTLADGEMTQEKFDWFLGIRAGLDPEFRKNIRKPSNK